ncbi:hypothetical protein K2173_025375 [Erythroxylum novogranatense]|uniref:Dehydrogenase E1 component domain-containing protein n=1 Tax=Erythroxylum novogranatense TaxID=1862640 RepID=A0AAV8UGD8_9ROSI|nr:hypothetical protein K2173_025375 [Erythroxylum novogranatense]
MASAFSATKFTQPLPVNTISSGSQEKNFLFDPLRSHKLNQANPHRRYAIVSVSDVVKEKKIKSSSSPLITKEEGLELYEDMVLGRAFEDMCAQMYYRGKMFGFVHLYNGQEAVSTGFIKLLRQDDYVVSTYRDHVHALSKGSQLVDLCTCSQKSITCLVGLLSLVKGFQWQLVQPLPRSIGESFEGSKQRSSDRGIFGDGTCNNGQFFECLNMAALWKLPIVFVVENNLWAIGMSHLRATSDPQIWKKGPAFGMPGVHVDGMDVLKIREVAKEAVGRARRGGPTLVECETYRFRGHSLADPDELRDPEAHYAARDPITTLKKFMIEQSLASEAEFKAIEKKIDEIVEDAVVQLLENVFADPKGFGIGPDGRYRCEDPKFTQGTAHV